ncbi:uncharacterized protein N7477_001331 [Penicillium maclennaniae]|uniref:uncharacterized protein n=1 Tax=Penicillium maclennaniae TaxID=1343394 RepID=UPI00254160A5|nr:uncharacterized protein N7477_001331 [Penicillium maclennaniae]KAJ5681391.1 hypothetical protein N7477_001331 [Penicillium maclennaniae]
MSKTRSHGDTFELAAVEERQLNGTSYVLSGSSVSERLSNTGKSIRRNGFSSTFVDTVVADVIPTKSNAPEASPAPNVGVRIAAVFQTLYQIQTLVFNQVSRVYHVMLRKSTVEELENAYRQADFDDPVFTYKFFALFALGEVYSARSNSSLECDVPGAAYYVNALMLIPILPERPSLTHIEALLLLSLYSYFLNRRYSGFLLVGSAMRLGLTLGLHHDIPESQCPDPVDRQHRIRLWWGIYVFDRMFGSKVGHPIQIADDDIFVEMPSDVPTEDRDEPFSDTQFLVASINLARMTGHVIEKLYSRKKQPDSFLQREQKLLIALKEWSQGLPPHIRLNREGHTPKNVVSLHLQLNQCIMLATRPILLHTLMLHRSSKPNGDKDTPQTNTQTLKTLGDACIHAARHTHSLIVEEWTNGSMPIYGYFYAHYLFSSALIMVISSEIHADNCSDFALFETATEILRSMSDHGNLAATEFHDNLECVRQCINKERGSQARNSLPSRVYLNSTESLSLLTEPAARSSEIGLPEGFLPPDDMGFLGQNMEEFLTLPDVDFGPLDPGMPINADTAYLWPKYSLWTA